MILDHRDNKAHKDPADQLAYKVLLAKQGRVVLLVHQDLRVLRDKLEIQDQ